MKIKFLSTIRTFSGILTGSILIATAPRHLSAPIKPMQNKIVANVADTVKPKDILVIDGFCHNHLYVDNDIFPDISHGELICGIIDKGLPKANIYKINMKKEYVKYAFLMRDSITTQLYSQMKKGIKYDAVNVSIGRPIRYYDLSKQMGTEINAENVRAKSREIKKYFLKNSSNTVQNKKDIPSRALVMLIDCLDSLSANGSKIYVAAGNESKRYFNAFSLVDNAINVGALDKKGQKAGYSCDNTLINRWAQGSAKVKRTPDGYVIKSAAGDIYVKRENTTSLWHIPAFCDIEGTSFSAPFAIVKDLQ